MNEIKGCYKFGCDCERWIEEAIKAGFTREQAIFLHIKTQQSPFGF